MSLLLTPEAQTSPVDVIANGTLQHVAMIMDGNRRWAKQQGLPSAQGHFQGYQALKTLVRYCSQELKLPVLTVYAFSTENWKRSGVEVQFLLKLFDRALRDAISELQENNIRIRFLGDLEAFPKGLQEIFQSAMEQTAGNTGMIYQVALNYGGRSEIVQACKEIAAAVQAGTLNPEAIDETLLGKYLYTQSIPDPDLVIRTGGEYRLSNFLMWQSAYSEIYIAETLWPEFSPERLIEAITDFTARQRRFGV